MPVDKIKNYKETTEQYGVRCDIITAFDLLLASDASEGLFAAYK